MKKDFFKVLRICPNLNYGINHNIEPFVNSLESLGVKQDVISEGIDFKTKTPFSAFRQGFAVAKKIDFNNYDLLHLHNPSFWWVLLKAKGKKPTITTFHGSLFYATRHFYIKSIKQNIEYILNGFLSLILSDYVIFVNKKDYDFFSKFTKKCFFIPTGYDPRIFKFSNKFRGKTGLFIGRENPNKNISKIENFCKKNNLTLEKVLGDTNFSKKELYSLYSKSKYILLFSYSEGFSKVLTEAIASGCIPIISDSSRLNLSEIGVDFLEEGNLITDILPNIKINAELIKVCSWDKIAKKTFNVYNLVCKKKLFYSNQKVLILEPHNDDAFLSMGGIILNNPNTNFDIVSIVSNNGLGSKWLSKILPNVFSIQLGMKNIHNGDNQKLFFEKNRLTKNDFERMIQLMATRYDVIILPIGIFHPLHKIFSKIKVYNSWRYSDLPYRFFVWEKLKFDLIHIFKRTKRFDISDKTAEKKDIILNCYKNVDEFINVGPGKKVFENCYEEVLF